MPPPKNDAPRRSGAAVPSTPPSPDRTARPPSSPPLDAATWKRLLALHPDGLVVSMDAAIRYANPAATTLLGADRDAPLTGRSLFHVLPPAIHQRLQQHRFLIECGEVPPPLDVTLPQPDGPPRTVQLRSTPTQIDGRYAMHTVLTDITDQRDREQALRVKKQEAEKMNRLKSRFLAQMSHEIRTPLTSIIGFAEILNENELGEWDEFTTYIERSSRRLLRTINSVLNLSRLEAGSLQLDPEPLDVGEAIREAAELFRPRAAQHGVQLQVEVSGDALHAQFDAKALGRILDNLISNAIKFTQDGGRVTVRSTHDGTTLIVEVEDTGVGIAPQFIPHLFEAFKQGRSQARDDQAGSGLGLAITHQLVELMDGSIGVESEPEVGTRFTVTLPIHPA